VIERPTDPLLYVLVSSVLRDLLKRSGPLYFELGRGVAGRQAADLHGRRLRVQRWLPVPIYKETVNEALRRVVLGELRRSHLDELAGGALPDLADPTIMAGAWR
jgi:Arc/MetJ family transcription regulator